MKTHYLVPHPATPPGKVRAVYVNVIDTADDLLLTFIVEGADALRMPDWEVSERADGLWKTTCFELFLQAEGADGYWEFNFSPSTQWAAYHFDGYRDGMRNFPLTVEPSIVRGDDEFGYATEEGAADVMEEETGYVIEVDFDLSDIPDSALHMGLSAVIEERSGRKSYWALAHPPGAPDFHHRDCFTLQLPPAV